MRLHSTLANDDTSNLESSDTFTTYWRSHRTNRLHWYCWCLLKEIRKMLLEKTSINEHAIRLVNDKHWANRLIYSIALVELKILKTYIETNLVNMFIQPSKSFAGASILFVQRPDNSFRLCIDYRDLNNLIIKNWFAYLQMKIKEGNKFKYQVIFFVFFNVLANF